MTQPCPLGAGGCRIASSAVKLTALGAGEWATPVVLCSGMKRRQRVFGHVRSILHARGEATYAELLHGLARKGVHLTYRALQARAKRWERKGWIRIRRHGFPARASLVLPDARVNTADTASEPPPKTLAGRVAQTWGVSERTVYRAMRVGRVLLQLETVSPDACAILRAHQDALSGVVTYLPLIPLRLMPYVAWRVAQGERSLGQVVRELLATPLLTGVERTRLERAIARCRSQRAMPPDAEKHLHTLTSVLREMRARAERLGDDALLALIEDAQTAVGALGIILG